MAGKTLNIGVLALQGGFDAHARILAPLGVRVSKVRRVEQLEGLDGLVLPGGESTTLLNLMQDGPWFERIKQFHERGGSMLATCAGAILVSREVRNPSQPSLALLDAVIERNAYGRQVDSFETRLDVSGSDRSIPAVFIRAPVFRSLGPKVEQWAEYDGQPVLVRQQRILAATFHPELAAEDWIHRRFVEIAGKERTADSTPDSTPDLVAP